MGRKDSSDDVSVRISDVLAAFGFFVDDKMFEIIDIKGIWILMNRVHPYLGLNHIWHGN